MLSLTPCGRIVVVLSKSFDFLLLSESSNRGSVWLSWNAGLPDRPAAASECTKDRGLDNAQTTCTTNICRPLPCPPPRGGFTMPPVQEDVSFCHLFFPLAMETRNSVSLSAYRGLCSSSQFESLWAISNLLSGDSETTRLCLIFLYCHILHSCYCRGRGVHRAQ